MAGNSIEINSNVNNIDIQPDFNKITVVNPDGCFVTITQPVTNVIQVAIPGPAGSAGPAGPIGPSGSFETGSFVTTSSFNAFTGSYNSGSFSGSFFGDGSGLTGIIVTSASFSTTAQTSSNSIITQGVTDNAQYLITIANSTDTIQPIQRPTAPILYSPSINNPITNASNKAAELQIGLNDQAGGISLISNLLSDNPNYIRTLNQDLYLKVKTTGTGKLFISASAGIETTGHITGSIDSSFTSSYVNPLQQNVIITGSLDVKNGNINIESNSYFLQGTSTGGSNVSLIGVNNQNEVYIGNQGYTNIIADNTNIEGDTQITGSLTVSGSSTFTNIGPAIFSGSIAVTNGHITASGNISASAFIGDGSQITGIVSSSYALTASYAENAGGGAAFPFEGDAVITGSLTVSTSITASGNISASGDIITNTLTASGLIYPTVDGENGDIIQTDGEGNLSFGRTRIYSQVKNISGGVLSKGIPVHVTSSVGNLDEVIASSASDASTMPATFVLAQQLNDGEEGLGILTGFINGVDTSGFNEGDIVYVAPNGGYTNQKPSGSNLIQNLGIVTKVGVNGSGFIYGSGRSNDVPNLLSGQIFFGSGSDQSHQIHISGALDQTIINNITASGNISSSGIVYGTTGSFSHLQGNSPITVGDPTTFQLGITGSNILLTSSIVDFDTEVSRSAQAAGFGTGGGGGGISAVVDDPSPQLGGNLDLNSQDITGTGNISIDTTSTATPSLLLTSTNDTSNASPIIDLKRNSSSPSNGDYLGQIKFKGENDANQEVVYAKITGKISDVTDTTEDGLIEFATKQNGSNVINARLTSTDLKLINGTGLEVDGNISASGDISAITGSFGYITGQVSTITWTVDFTDGELNTTLYAPYNLAINSVTNIYNSPTTAISSSGSPYTLGNAITTGEPIDITVSTGSVINLNITR